MSATRLGWLAALILAAEFMFRYIMSGDWNVITHVTFTQRVAAGIFLCTVIALFVVESGKFGRAGK